jgi:hypothetical protein
LGGLHLVVARLEALRGHCINARRHLEIARHLFGPNCSASTRSLIRTRGRGS